MKLVSRPLLLAAVVVAAFLSCCAPAGAAIVTLGANLAGPYESESCGETCTLLNTAFKQPGGKVVAPKDGVILRWHVVEGLTAGEYHLRLANRAGVATYSFLTASQGVQSSAAPGIQAFEAATPIPIKAGQDVALEMSATASVGQLETESELGSFAEWAPSVADNVTQKAQTFGEGTIGYNVEMQPMPTITALSAASGISTGGTPVTITGTDFEGTSAVTFGGVAATSFTVVSESQVTAVVPPGTATAVVPVALTTIAGTATSPQSFTYAAPPTPPAPVNCTVPNLKGKNLKAAKAALKKAQCKLGKVTKLAGATAKSGKVTKQGAKAGAKVVVGTKVDVTIKGPKVAHKKGGKGKH